MKACKKQTVKKSVIPQTTGSNPSSSSNYHHHHHHHALTPHLISSRSRATSIWVRGLIRLLLWLLLRIIILRLIISLGIRLLIISLDIRILIVKSTLLLLIIPSIRILVIICLLSIIALLRFIPLLSLILPLGILVRALSLAAFRVLSIATVRLGVVACLGLRLRAVRATMGLTSRVILVVLTISSGVGVLAVHVFGAFLEDGSSRSRVGRSEGLGGKRGAAASRAVTGHTSTSDGRDRR